jgi:nucleotide-binding universal stress UspA family protein
VAQRVWRNSGQFSLGNDLSPKALGALIVGVAVLRRKHERHVYKVEVGHVCIYRMVHDGRRQVIDFAYPGDFIGLGALGTHAANAQATTKTRIRCVTVDALHEVAGSDQRLGLRADMEEDGSDLLVMGAYGHSRLQEFIFGGATRDVLRHMTVPVLMSH